MKMLPFSWIGALIAAGLAAAHFLSTPIGRANAQADELLVRIEFPAEGETLYAGPSSLQYSIKVFGWVAGYAGEPTDLVVSLEILQQGKVLTSQEKKVFGDNSYAFYVTVNPYNSEGEFPAELKGCVESCHFSTATSLPVGDVLLRVTARDPNGRRAQVERRIKVDRSTYATLPVQLVSTDGSPFKIANIPVTASTRLYLWRARNATSSSDVDGFALLEVETLSQKPTHYVLRVEPTIVDGILYQSLEPVEIALLPGLETAARLQVAVSAQMGKIEGRIFSKADMPTKLSVWAINSPLGTHHRVDLNPSGKFSFQNLPVGYYVLLVSSGSEKEETILWRQAVNLASSLESNQQIELPAFSQSRVEGVVTDTEGNPLPFSWVMADASGVMRSIAVVNSGYRLVGLPPGQRSLTASAPGYYSQAQALPHQTGISESTVHIDWALERRPETRILSWGEGQVYLPPESKAHVGEGQIALERGWLWGEGGPGPMKLFVGDFQVLLHEGKFSLEHLPGETSWLYLHGGGAEVQLGEFVASLQAGQMVALIKGREPVPVAFENVVVQALQEQNPGYPALVWQPSLAARLRDRLAQLGINAAQVITFITYGMVFISVVLAPFAGIYWLIKLRRSLRR